MSTEHINKFYGVEEMLEHLDGEYEFSEVLDEIKKYYDVKLCDDVEKTLGDEADKENDDDKVEFVDIDTMTYKGDENDPEFVISVDDSDERCDFYSEDRYNIQLPNRKAAEELAYAISSDAIIVEDGSSSVGSKTYRITYRMEVYVKAENEDDAKTKFQNMAGDKLKRDSEFVEMVSCEDASTL